MGILIESLEPHHVRSEFTCKHPSLQVYIRQYVSQDIKRFVARCYVSIEEGSNIITGYYTLSASALPKATTTLEFQKQYGVKYKDIPLTLLGRLAVNEKHLGKKIGKELLMNAIIRSYTANKTVASLGLIANFIDQDAKDFYLHFGFIHLPDTNFVLLPFKDVEANMPF